MTTVEPEARTALLPETKAAIDALQSEYAIALDAKDMARWVGCFAERPDATYICTTRENVQLGLPIAFMLDDCRARIEDRIKFVDQIWKGTFEDYQTRHLITPLTIEPAGDAKYAVTTNFCVFSTEEASGISTVLVAGIYEDVVEVEGGQARFLSRKAILDTNVQPRYLVYPV